MDFTWPPGNPTKRPPCGGWLPFSKAATIGDIHQHYDSTYEKVPVLHNLTQVYNPVCTPECCSGDRPTDCGSDCCPPADCPPACPDGQPATVPPTPRPACIDPVTHDANSNSGCDGGAPCGPEPATVNIAKYVNGNCGATALPPVACGATKIGDNCYSAPDLSVTKDFSTCRFLGFKNLLARKRWHGTTPFGAEPCAQIETIAPCGDCPDVDCSSRPENNGPAKYKYRHYAINYSRSSWSLTSPSEIHHTSTVFSATTEVSTMGRLTRTASGSQNVQTIQADGTVSEDTTTVLTDVPEELATFLANYLGKCSGTRSVHLKASGCNPFGVEGDLTITRTGDYQLELHFEPNPGTTAYRMQINCNDGSTEYHWETSPMTGCGDGTTGGTVLDTEIIGDTYDVTITLSVPYTSADVMGDIEGLLVTWDLTNHALYPPRLDAVTNGGPMVCFNEVPSDVDPFGYVAPSAIPWTDTTPPEFPTRTFGDVVGAPLPIGAEPYFDFYHKVWALDDATYGYNAPKFYGQLSSSAPFYCPHMTLWTDETHHVSLPHGPFVYCSATSASVGAGFFLPHYDSNGNQIGGPDGVWASKWAEVIMFEKPPHNYQRPCGAYDAATLDLTTVNCALTDPLSVATPLFPHAPCDCDDARFVGKIVAVSNTTPVVVQFDSAHGLSDGQLIHVCNVRGCTAANGKRTAQVVSADTVQLFDGDEPSTPIAGNGGYTGGGSASFDNGGEQVWNDFWAKGNFVFKEWIYNFRDWFESYRCIIQAHQRDKLNASRDADSNCPDGSGHDCCPDCPTLTAPGAVRFTVADEELVHSCDGSDAGCSTLDVGNIMEEGNERNGGSKWLQAVNCHQYCVVHSPCAPCMAYVVPPASVPESDDPTDKFVSMPFFGGDSDPFQLDWYYGSLWIGRVEQWMPDPLWKPFGNGHELLQCGKYTDGTACDEIAEDDGNCNVTRVVDGSLVCTFPQRPYEEAECAAPDGAPALPAGSRIMGCVNYIANLNLSTPSVNNQDIAPGVPDCHSPYNFVLVWKPSVDAFGDVELDDYCGDGSPSPCGGSGNGHYVINAVGPGELTACYPWTPWIWLLNQQSCVKRDGVFADDYKRNGTVSE